MTTARKLELVAEAFAMIQIDPEDLTLGYMFQITQCELDEQIVSVQLQKGSTTTPIPGIVVDL